MNESINDFKKLITFVQKYHYQLGIFILYNYNFNEFVIKLKNEMNSICDHKSTRIYDKIIIICKKSECSKSEIHTLQEIISNPNIYL